MDDRVNEKSGARLPRGYVVFTAFTVVACIGLCWQVLTLSRQVRELRAAQDAAASQAATRAGSSAVTIGEYVPPLAAIGADGKAAPSEQSNYLNFKDGRYATVMLATSGGCHTCEQTLPVFDVLARKHISDGITVVAVQIDAMKTAELKASPGTLPVVMVNDSPGTWLRRIPLAPSVLVIDGDGAVRQTWFGAMSGAQQDELDRLIEKAQRGWK
ncbi:MAG: hypothetical protein JSR77_14645 [Planctomycetes bacterium]|nr:hypothetical protein [Planctomycetota bacterium]